MDWKLGGLGVLLALACADACAQRVTDEIDRFTGQRKIGYTSTAKVDFGVPHVSLFGNQGGKTPLNGVRFMIAPTLGRYAVQNGMQYLGCKQINWLVDGKPMELGIVVHSMTRAERVLVEFLTQEVSTDQLAAIGSGQSVEYRICGTEGRFSSEDIAAAAEISRRLRGATAPAAGAAITEGQAASQPVADPRPAPPASGMKYRPKLP